VELIAMYVKTALIGAVAATALALAPLTPASAHGYRHFGLIGGIFALGTAVVVGAATVATAPFRVLAGPPAYAPPPTYYAPPPRYYYAPPAPQYYAPPPAYYSAPYGYYGR
jgi:hypothetical protein